MRDFFDDFYDEIFTMGFGKPRKIMFNSGKTQDMNPAYWSETENGYKAVCRTVGINEDDVIVELQNNCIKISGETEYEGSKYNVSYELPVSDDVLSNVTKLEYKTLNGLTYIYISVDRPKKKEIVAKKIK